MKEFKLEKTVFLQSELLSLQTSGSTGDDSPKGIHLRWFFQESLGKNHLPLGRDGLSENIINPTDDFVNIYRIRYDKVLVSNAITKLDLRKSPYKIHVYAAEWIYKVKGIFFKVVFLDDIIYHTTKININYYEQHKEFYEKYCSKGGKVEITLIKEMCYAIHIGEKEEKKKKFDIKLETFSKINTVEEETITNRIQHSGNQKFKPPQVEEVGIVGENMVRIRYQIQGEDIPLVFRFSLYSKTVKLFEPVEAIDQFSISKCLDEDYIKNQILNTQFKEWQRWKNGLLANEGNYDKKWKNIRGAVTQLLEDVKNNEAFYSILQKDESVWNEDKFEANNKLVQNFNALSIASIDFHIARILGLGHSDKLDNEHYFIYLMEYNISKNGTSNALLSEIPNGQHLYISLPTSAKYNKVVQDIKSLPVKYGYSDDRSNMISIDEEGYTADGTKRLVRLFCDDKIDYTESQHFFYPSHLFSAANISPSVLGGVFHRKENDGWEIPELRYIEKDGINEVNPVIIQKEKDVATYIHEIGYKDNNSIHQYTLYPIDIFSRSGELSNVISTDLCKFKFPNNLLPPSNIRVQLIQEEKPLVFTTPEEQRRLGVLEIDKTLLRITFDYNHVHDINSTRLANPEFNHFGEEVEFYFREEVPRILPALSDEERANVNFNSSDADFSIVNLSHPIEQSIRSNFRGGVFSTNGYNFKILNILGSKKIKVEGIYSTTINADEDSVATYSSSIKYPIEFFINTESRYYTITENIKSPSSWPNNNPLGFKIPIGHQNWEKRNVDLKFIDESGLIQSKVRTLRGFWGDAIIRPMKQGGYYEVEFLDLAYPEHALYSPNPYKNSVEFFRGSLRVPNLANKELEWKVLDVMLIVPIREIPPKKNKLKLIVIDREFSGVHQILTNREQTVNFYPGYLCYLLADRYHDFSKKTIYPKAPQFEKNTIISLRANGANPNNREKVFYSTLSSPQTIRAERAVKAVKPKPIEPLGALYATPPDSYSKSTFSFKLPLPNEDPYEIVIYRADMTAVLSALYTPATVKTIKGLKLKERDDFFTNRFKDLVNFTLREGEFREYDKYQLPTPDNLEYSKDVWKHAIWNNFLPITEKPILFSSIIYNEKITRKIPVKLLSDNQGNRSLLITDFNIDGEKITSYFYMARAIGSRADISEPSEILGPIQLINNRPPKAPIVRKVFSYFDANKNPSFSFDLLAYPEYDNIKKIEIRKTSSKLKSKNWRMMEVVKVKTISGEELPNDFWKIIDDSYTQENHKEIHFGKEVFYRISVQREIKYERKINGVIESITEHIPSLPSKVFSKKLIDNLKPPIPELYFKSGEDEFNVDLNNNNPIANFHIYCTKSCYGGKYYLESLNNQGIWKEESFIESNDGEILLLQSENYLLEVNGKRVYPKFRVKVINTNGLDSGWSKMYVI